MKRVFILVLLLISSIGLNSCGVTPKNVVKIEIITQPSKLVYIVNQDTQLDYSGAYLIMTYSNQETIEIKLNLLIGDPSFVFNENVDFNTVGTYVVEVVRMGDLKASFEVEVQLPPYQDDNPISIGLYDDSTRVLLTETNGIFKNEIDVGVYSAFASREEKLASGYFQNVWPSYWEAIEGSETYKLGYELSFTLSSGEKINQMILSPKDTAPIFDLIEVYIYDDVNQPLHHWYSHLLEKQMTDKTVITSIKLHGCEGTKDIVSPLILTVFTYNGEEDFDPVTHKYRGIGSYSIIINKSN
jgi:hypothetical protein